MKTFGGPKLLLVGRNDLGGFKNTLNLTMSYDTEMIPLCRSQ